MRHYIAIIIAGVVDAAGHPIVYSSGEDAANRSMFSGATYALRGGKIVSLSAFAEAIEDGASVATSGVTTVTLPADDMGAIGYRPIDIFSRLGAESLRADQVWSTQGITAGASTITLAAGTAQTLSPNVLHIGTEAIQPSSASVPASGDVAISRGIARTVAMPHRANLSGFLARTIPVTTVPVEWIGRRVYVYVDNALWRTMMLADNPHVDAQSVTLSVIDIVNQLSIAKKSCQVPAYATTLSAQSIALDVDVLMSRPAFSVPTKRANAMVTTPGSFGATGDFTGGTESNRKRVLYAMDWSSIGDGFAVRYGMGAMPSLTLQLQADSTASLQATTYELPMLGGTGAATTSPASTCKFGAAVNTEAYWDFYSEASSRQFLLMKAEFGAVTFWAGLGIGYLGTAADFDAPVAWNYSAAAAAPWAAKMDAAGLLRLNARFAVANGWPDFGLLAQPLYVGLCYRRNLAPGDDAEDVPTGSDLVAGLYSAWPQSDLINSSSGPIETTFGGEMPDYRHAFYPMRPKDEGDLHNVVLTAKGVVCAVDAFRWARELSAASIPIEYCEAGRWWEPGVYSIKTTAEIPMPSGETSREVEIRWQEPSGDWLRALATVHFVETSGGVSTYAIDQSVKMLDGSPCVGFGSWHGFAPCQVTPPTFVSAGSFGWIIAEIIASGDSTSGRNADFLGDGFAVPIGDAAMDGFRALIPGGMSGTAFRFAADEDFGYNDFLELACRISGYSIAGKLHDGALVSAYCPTPILIGRPMASEVVATWTDAEIIGIPSTTDGYAGPVYTSYSITLDNGRRSRHWQVDDWLAGDILGQGEELEIDLTPIVTRPQAITDESIEALVDRLRDRFGTLRRRWVLRVPIDIGIDRNVGDVVAVTSQYLVDPAGGLGVTDRLARILSITHDFVAGVCDVELIAYAEYGAGWSASWDVTIASVSGSAYTLALLGGADAAGVRRIRDLTWQPVFGNASYTVYLYQVEGPSAGGVMRGWLSNWGSAGDSVVFNVSSHVANPPPSTGFRGLLVADVSSLPTNQVDLFRLGRDRLL